MLPSKVGAVFIVAGISFLLAIVAGTPFSARLDESKSSGTSQFFPFNILYRWNQLYIGFQSSTFF